MKPPSKIEQDRRISHIRELYHGRFNRQEVRALLEHHDWKIAETNDFIINSEPGTVRQLIHDKSEAELADILQDQMVIARARKNIITKSLRLFACETCDNSWWTKVSDRKPVSECRKCKTKYDAIPREDEWGWALFECKCGNEFSGFGQMNVTESECYKCHTKAKPKEIRPPNRRAVPKSTSRHSCDAPDCCNKGHTVNGDDHKECVHPDSRKANGKKRVVLGSHRHVSTGSTVDSFVADDDDVISVVSEAPTLESIQEDDGNPREALYKRDSKRQEIRESTVRKECQTQENQRELPYKTDTVKKEVQEGAVSQEAKDDTNDGKSPKDE